MLKKFTSGEGDFYDQFPGNYQLFKIPTELFYLNFAQNLVNYWYGQEGAKVVSFHYLGPNRKITAKCSQKKTWD